VIVNQSSSGRFALRARRWKLCFSAGSGGWSAPKDAAAREQGLPPVQLYDLEADPGELHNLAEESSDLVEKLTARFRSVVQRAPNDGDDWWQQLPWPRQDD